MIGLVVGKFAPLHCGHRFLIDTALESCDYVYVLTYANPDFGYSQIERELSLYRVFEKEVTAGRLYIVGPIGDVPHNNRGDKIHRKFSACELFNYVAHMVAIEGKDMSLPDTVFSSEDYGQGFADFLSKMFNKKVSHVMVDRERVRYPISATKIRAGGYDDWKV